MSWLAIDRYAERYGIEGCDFEDLKTVLNALDTEYLAWQAEQRKEEEK